MDTFVGTTKDDLFIADNSGTKTNASAADTLDGGKGVDTFKVYDSGAAGAAGLKSLPTLKNIENVVIYDNQTGALNLTKWDTVETLFLVNSVTTTGITLGEKVTTVNFEDIAAANAQVVTFDKALTAAAVGVNKVGTTTAPTAPTSVTVNGTALKTLTVDASGKASNVTLAQTTATIETLNITGKADLTLGFGAVGAAKIVTIDGSKAEGKLALDLANTAPATLKTVKTGTGDDTVSLGNATTAATVASGTTIDLGAGNDKLVKGNAASTIAAGSIIDGGAGIDSLDAALVNSGNAGVFANFEILSLTDTATDLDLALLNKSTITTIAIDYATTPAAAAATVRNVSTSQSLTVNANNATGGTTTLSFKDATGTADAYTINFNADNAANTNAQTVVINGIETVTVNSVGKTGVANTITLADKDAKSLVITGDKDLTVLFDGTTKFGTVSANATDGLGVSTIDASASTAGITLTGASIGNLGIAWSGLTIKGGAGKDTIDLSSLTTPLPAADSKIIVNAGAGDDTIVTSVDGGILTGGAGKDTFNIANTVLTTNLTEAGGVVKVTITDLTAGDTIKFKDQGTEVFNKTQVNVSGAQTLDDALDAAFNGGNGSTNAIISWFQFADNTYIVQDLTAAGTNKAQAGDIVVKINGLVDLTNSTFDNSGTNVDLTIA